MLTNVVSRSSIFGIIIALALASVSATSVFAAGLMKRNSRTMDVNLTSQWKQELTNLQMEKFLNSNIGKWYTEWQESKPSRYKRVRENKYATAAAYDLQQAETIATKHTGFDAKGKVIDKAQATNAIQGMELYLHRFHMEMRDRLLPRF